MEHYQAPATSAVPASTARRWQSDMVTRRLFARPRRWPIGVGIVAVLAAAASPFVWAGYHGVPDKTP